jgi:mRNA interferase MazF
VGFFLEQVVYQTIATEVKRGDIYYADLSPVIGSEQGGMRPVLVVQNDIGNKFSPTIIVCAITSQLTKARLPTHLELKQGQFGLPKDSVILLEQIRTIDKRRLKDVLGHLDEPYLHRVDKALLISLGL